MAKRQKEYGLNDTLSLRLTEKAGATPELVEWINDQESVTQEVIKAMKLWQRLNKSDKEASIDHLKKQIEYEAQTSEINKAHYGENRGPYKKNKPAGGKIENKPEKPKTKAEAAITIIRNNNPPPEPIVHDIGEYAATTQSYEDELFAGTPVSVAESPMARALRSIPRAPRRDT